MSGLDLPGITKAAALRAVAWDAYEAASEGVGFAPFRMGGYQARRMAEERYGIPADSITITHRGDWGNALRTLDPEIRSRMKIVNKARGTGYEPHTYRRVAFGTLEVEEYQRGWRKPDLSLPGGMSLSPDIRTHGPEARFDSVLLIEKDGLMEILRTLGIDREFDIMLAASEGQGVEALKALIEELTLLHPGVTIYLLHDYDIAGVQIAAAMTGRETKSWSWSVTPNVVDLGVHYEDIARYGILDETVSGEDDWLPLLRGLGSSVEEIDYLVAEQWEEASSRKNRRGKPVTFWRGRRAELNGLKGRAFAQYVRDKLTEAEVTKLIPDDGTLEQAYRRADHIHRINAAVEEALAELEEVEAGIPENLRERVEQYIVDNPSSSWDDAIAEIAGEAD